MKTLYDITGDIKDINTLLVQRSEYETGSQDAKRYRFIRDVETEHSILMSLLRLTSDALDAAIDAAMKENKQ